jgi:PAS domain S-box-containing protein
MSSFVSRIRSSDRRRNFRPPNSLDDAYWDGSWEVLSEDEQRILCRGWRRGAESERRAVLVVLPAGEHPSKSNVDRLIHEYGMRTELNGAWAAQPLELLNDRGRVMLVLEDTGGEPLDESLGAPAEVGRFLCVAIGIATALGRLHKGGFVHKDIKPANILANSATGEVRLTGFGIASRLSRQRLAVEPAGAFIGTLAYMAPEQTGRMNRPIDSRSDLYALGVTLYEILTGALPFTAADPIEWVHCHLARQPLAPAERLSGIPNILSEIVVKLLAKSPEDRYQTATGLESDLRKCLADWEARRGIADFPLGEYDTPDRLVIPEKLYGRHSEVEALRVCLNRVVHDGALELVLVSGYSGVGKSSVVEQLSKEFFPPHCLFASGKCDQYKRDIPYGALAQAFQSLIRPLLSGSETELSKWRGAFQDALGPNAKVIANLVPELHLVVGEPAPLPDLPLQDAQRRFQLSLRRFIGVFAKPEHPLALFLDDLQWLDSATLDFIEGLLAQSDVRHLMLIGAYRDNEINATHPLTHKLDTIRKAGAPVSEIVLAPLDREQLGRLIGDSLRCEPEIASTLVQLVHEKTAGNPFFAIQFLTVLAEEGLIAFDPKTRTWSWDSVGINAKGFTDNLVDLMLGRLRRLPSSAQDALKLLACLGNNAEAETLERVLAAPKAEVRESLDAAVRDGIIIAHGEQYRFLHDRVQEAAYALIPDHARSALHLTVGRRLLTKPHDEDFADESFEAVNHLNLGASAIADPKERARLARLNLEAGLRAKTSTAYASACSYFEFALAAVGDRGWEQHYELTCRLILERAECELLRANVALSGELIELLHSKARSKMHRTEAYRLQVTLQLLRGEMALAVRTALECLEMFEMAFPERPTLEDVRREYDDLRHRMDFQPVESLLELPLMEDPEIRALSGVLLTLGESSYFIDEHLFAMLAFRMVRLSIDFGHSSSCILGYGGVGIVLGPTFDRFDDGERFARVAVAVVERHGFDAHRPGAYVLLQMASLWTAPIDEALACLDAADKSARENGEVVFACISAEHRVTNLLARGQSLDVIWPESINRFAFVQKRGYAHIADILLAIQRFVAALRGDISNDRLVGDAAILLRTGLPVVQCYYWILQLQLRYLKGDVEGAIEASGNARPLLWSARCHIQTGNFRFYHTLALLAALRSRLGLTADTLQRDLAENIAALAKLADTAPHTYAHKQTLVAAEVAGAEGRDVEAMRLYEQGVRSALEKGFVQDAAVGAELAGDFFARCGLGKIAQSYRSDASELYRRWGALGKVAWLESRHADIRPEAPRSQSATVETALKQIDLSMVIEISQAVSGELVLEKLIDKVMRAAIEHAGAQRGLLIGLRAGELRIEAEATTRGDDVAVRLMDVDLSAAALPESLIRYVMRTQETVILDDARNHGSFASDAYVVERCARSVLCLPLVNRGKLVGILYLENNLARQVFTSDRVAILKVLASQASISLENSRLYHDIGDREAKIRRLVDANVLGIFFWNVDGAIIEANEAFLRMLGYEREDVVSGRLRWTELSATDPCDSEESALAELEASGTVQPYEMELLHRDNRRLPVLLGGALFEEGGNQGVAFVLDLTERRRAEEALRNSEEALRRSEAYLAEAQSLSHTASVAYNNSSILYWSDETYRMFGFDPHAGLPSREAVLERIHPDDRERTLEQARRAVEQRCDYRLEYRVILPSGAVKYIELAAHPKFSATGELAEVVSTLIDMTERRRAQDEQRKLRQLESDLAHVNRLSVMGELAASLAHEITQPIAAARNNARAALNFLSRRPPDLAEVSEALDCVVGDADRAGQIVDRIRDHIKDTPPRKDRVDLNEAIEEVIGLARSVIVKNGVAIQRRLTEGLVAVRGDRVQMQQVVLNLILNAVEAMGSVDEGARVLVLSTEHSGTGDVLVAVRDSGPGIDLELREHLFDAFYTTKPSGLGMGLSICRSIIVAHGGRLWAGANDPGGAVFQFILPSAERNS